MKICGVKITGEEALIVFLTLGYSVSNTALYIVNAVDEIEADTLKFELTDASKGALKICAYTAGGLTFFPSMRSYYITIEQLFENIKKFFSGASDDERSKLEKRIGYFFNVSGGSTAILKTATTYVALHHFMRKNLASWGSPHEVAGAWAVASICLPGTFASQLSFYGQELKFSDQRNFWWPTIVAMFFFAASYSLSNTVLYVKNAIDGIEGDTLAFGLNDTSKLVFTIASYIAGLLTLAPSTRSYYNTIEKLFENVKKLCSSARTTHRNEQSGFERLIGLFFNVAGVCAPLF